MTFLLSLLPGKSRLLVQDEGGRTYIRRRNYRQNALAKRKNLPDLSLSLEEYTRNLRTIINICERNNVRIILVTQPSLWQSSLSEAEENLLWMGGVGDFGAESGHEYYSIEALAEGMKMYNELLLLTSRNCKVERVDLASSAS